MNLKDWYELRRLVRFWDRQGRAFQKEVKRSRSMLGLFCRDHVCECGVEDNAVCQVCGKCYLCHKDLNEIYNHADLYHQLDDEGEVE